MTTKKKPGPTKAAAKKPAAKKSKPRASFPAAQPLSQGSPDPAAPATGSSEADGSTHAPAAAHAAEKPAPVAPAKKLGTPHRVNEGPSAKKTTAHKDLDAAFGAVKGILLETAEDPKQHPRQLRWALKAVDAAHAAAKSHVDRNL